MAQILFKLHYAVLIGNIFLLKELHVLFTGNLSLYRVVWKRDQMSIKKLVIDFIWGFENDYGVAVDHAYEESKHGSTETHDILEELHFFILFTLNLKEEEYVIVVRIVLFKLNSEVFPFDFDFALLESITLL